MARYCPNCGETVAESDAFCGECGTALGGEEGDGESGWGDTADTGQTTQNTGWDDAGNTGQNPQNTGWEGGQGGRGQQQQPPRQGPPGVQGGGVAGIPRKNAIDTFVQGVKWLVAVPALLGAFFLVEVLNGLGQFVTGLFSLAGSILTLLVFGAAYVYTERFVYGGDVQGGVDGVLSTVSEVASRLLALIGIGLIYIIVVFVGLLFLLVPGIYLGARLVLAFPACVLDGEGVTDSLSTSWDVAEGNLLKLVGLGAINFLAAIGFGIAASVVAAVVGGLSAVESPVFTLAIAPVSAVLSGAVQMAIARVYIENRPPEPQPQGQQAGGYQQEPTQY